MAEILRPTWAEFLRQFEKRWEQGEHIFINGQTGSGKTEMLLKLLDLPKQNGKTRHSTVFVTKPRDPIFTSPFARGYRRTNIFNPRSYDYRLMLSAKRGNSTANDVGNQHEIFSDAFDKIYKQGGWTVGVDETLWISRRLKLGDRAGDGAYMGRALGLSYVFATQRPRWIPLIIPQSASHAFIGKVGQADDRKTLAELGGDPRELMAALRTLRDQHDFVYIDTQNKLPLMIVNTRR